MTTSINKKEFYDFFLNNEKGLYVICSAKMNKDYTKQDRCDAFEWGPAGALKSTDIRSSSIFGSSIIKDVNQLEVYRILYDFSPHGYLIYVNLRHKGAPGTHDLESEKYLLNKEDPPCAAKNIGNLLKLIIEWSKVKEHPWDNTEDPISEICTNFISHTKMPQRIIDYINDNYQDMQVYRYLKNNPDARNQEKVNNKIDQESLDWFINLLPEESV